MKKAKGENPMRPYCPDCGYYRVKSHNAKKNISTCKNCNTEYKIDEYNIDDIKPIKNKIMEISNLNRDNLIREISIHLDTRDKRYMFLKCYFSSHVSSIQLEGNPTTTAWNIYEEFRKQNMIGSLMACINSTFDTDLYINVS